MNKMEVPQASALIEENLVKEAVRRTPLRMPGRKRFPAGRQGEVELCRAGHDVSVQPEAERSP
jgi:hypothetical protein